MKTNSLLLLLGVLLLMVANWQWPFLRFTNAGANEAVALLVALIPLVFVGAGIGQVNKWPNRWRWASISLTLGLLLISLPFLLLVSLKVLSLSTLGSDQDLGFEKVAQIDEHVAVYRTNGGATTAYGIVVRQEVQVLPGVLLVKQVFSQYRLDKIAYTKTGRRLTLIHPYSHQVLEVVTLNRLLYL